MSNELIESKQSDTPAAKPKVLFHHCAEFNDTYKKHSKTQGVKEALAKFIGVKSADPMAKHGSKDYPMIKDGPIGKAVDGIHHAGLTQDISVFYKLHGGGDTRHINLYGVYTHAEAGIGNSANINRQKDVGKRLKSQEFE